MKSNSKIKIIIISSICLAAIIIFVLAFNFENLVSSASPDNLQDLFTTPPISSPEDESVSDEISSIEVTPSETLPEETLPEETLPKETLPEETDTAEDLELLKYFNFTESHLGSYIIALKPDAPHLTEITIPETFRGKPVTSIMPGGFKNCASLKALHLSNVEIVGSYAFEGCTALESVTTSQNLLGIMIDAFAFDGCSSLESIHLWNILSVHIDAFSNCDALHTVILSGTVDDHDSVLFFIENSKIKRIILKEISPTPRMFKKFTYLTEVDLSDQTYIPEYLFYRCSNLSTVVLGENLNTIKEFAFAKCPSLQQISIPKSVLSIGEGIFADCTALNTIYYGGTLDDWEKIDKHDDWDADTGEYIIYCSNGSIIKHHYD